MKDYKDVYTSISGINKRTFYIYIRHLDWLAYR